MYFDLPPAIKYSPSEVKLRDLKALFNERKIIKSFSFDFYVFKNLLSEMKLFCSDLISIFSRIANIMFTLYVANNCLLIDVVYINKCNLSVKS